MEDSRTGAELQGAVDDAQKMLGDLFDVMGIKRIVIVDDKLSDPAPLETVIGEIESRHARGDETFTVGTAELKAIDFATPSDVWKRQLRELWAGLSSDVKAKIGDSLSVGGEGDPDLRARGLLGRLLGKWHPIILSLASWNAERSNLMMNAVGEATLFLFDQDMTDNGGAVDEGMRTISTLLKQDGVGENMYFGLFSNLVAPNAEHEAHTDFTTKYELQKQKDRFAVISKRHLDENPRALAFRLKRVAISPLCDSLKTRLFGAIVEATDDAKRKVESLDIYDFEQIVFQSSYREGVWEADTLLRLFGIFHRDAARSRAKNDSLLTDAADKVRSVIAFPYKPDDAPATRVTEVARLEMYETAEYLIAHRMPIEVGDIFQKTTGKSQFIVLEQPCDLMVRGDTGKRGVEEVLLAEIVQSARNSKELPESFVELKYHTIDVGKKCFAKLAECATIPICILDLCVFGADGASAIAVGQPCPAGLIPAWKKRYEIIQSVAKSMVDRYRALCKPTAGKGTSLSREVDKVVQAALTRSTAGVVTGTINLNPDRIAYSIKRVGRLKQPFAGKLLRDFSYHKSRDAFEHDLTRMLDTTA